MTKLPDDVVHAAVEGYFGYKMPPSEERNQTMRRALDAASLNIVAHAERLEGDIERLERMLDEKDFELSVLRRAFEDYAEREKELRLCLRWFADRNYDHYLTFEEALKRSKRVLGIDK